jgi:hydroxymethylbilane synthase
LRLKIGSRGSQLALWQAHYIAQKLRERKHEVEIEIIHTTGDKITDVPLAKVGSKGMFTKEIEEALDDNRIDLAVHSLKDLPTEFSERFVIAAIPTREDPRDAFCSKQYSSVAELPQGARVGTSSLRREAQLKALRPDLVVHPLRGNVDTRLRKMESGECDAIILASAGLHRLRRTELIRQIIPIDIMCPSAGQGALAVEIRSNDRAAADAIAFLDDLPSRAEVDCERTVLQRLGGGCQVPIGANAALTEGELRLEAIVAMPNGKRILRKSGNGNDPIRLGEAVADALLGSGAADILAEVYGKIVEPPQQP